VIGAKIRMERLKLNYSQEGLCKDICTVSYLSKIEQGQVEAGENIIQLLFQKLHINFRMDEEFLKEAGKLIDSLYDEFYSFGDMTLLSQELKQKKEEYLNSPYLLDTLLFLESETNQEEEELNPYVSCMEQRQYEVYLYIQCLKGIDKSQELLHLNPNAYYTTHLGIMRCQRGQFVEALELLIRGSELCAKEGYVKGMLHAQTFLGNSYSGLNNNELMFRSYKVAARIAKSLKEAKIISEINYNIGASLLEWNQVQQAKEYLEQCTERSILFYQKYAICLEKSGDYEQAKKILQEGYLKLQQAIEESEEVLLAWEKMYGVVDYRLTHKDYIHEAEYEEKLYDCIMYLKGFLPVGYVKFHIPYYIEVLEKKRRYKDIYKILNEFS
jgi:transcriptional regulator with XRE-family HTH domain